MFRWQRSQTNMWTQTDSDWAGDVRTRKSTSGGSVRLGMHLVKSWAKDQASIATSSGEAELYSANKGIMESYGIQGILKDFGMSLGIHLEVDAKATVGMISRQGVGEMKHVDVQELWLQEHLKKGRFVLAKIPRLLNTADMMASPSKPEDLAKNMVSLWFEYPAK